MNRDFQPETCLPLSSCSQLLVAIDAARIAGKLLMDHFHGAMAHREKPGENQSHNLVTQADIDAEQAIAIRIRESFPNHQLLGEEGLTGDLTADDLWVIDPLDGTNNFAHRIPHFAVSIAYYHLGVATVGVVYNPAHHDWFWATSAGPAMHNGRPLSVSNEGRLDQALLACGFYYDRGAMMRATLATIDAFFTQQIHGIRRMGAAALDLCGVAAGQFGGYFEYKLNPWDFAAGELIVRQSGGKVMTARGAPLGLTQSSILATNGLLHSVMLETLLKFHP